MASKTLDFWPNYTVNPANLELSKYGGWKARRHDLGTGFFRVEKINGRWWAIDPEGYLYIHMALNSVNLQYQTADQIYAMMREHGFNGFGNWTLDGNHVPTNRNVIAESTVKDTIPMAYTPRVLFIGQYRTERLPAGTPRIELPVFDPGFETRALVYAQDFLPFVKDPHVFGYFSDNELPFRHVLADHLAITNTSDPNYQEAVNFLTARDKSPSNWDQSDADAYTAHAGERYYSVVSQAIRSVDPNHMYLGSRQHSAEKGNQAFMENAGQYVDIMSLNHYHHWGDRRINTNAMENWLGRPIMFTEFYVKSLEHGPTEGSGFNGRNQTARALFYQNYISTHAESGNLVGFHWFKYDNGENNTGVISQTGEPYTELLDSMKQMNTRIYDFIDYVDSRRPAPDATLTPEADAYFEGVTNRGSDPELKVKYASSSGMNTFRQTYMRFDVSSLGNQIDSAKIVLRTVESGGTGVFQVELVEDDTWGETTIRNSNAPAGSSVLQTFSDGRSDLEIDVSSVIRQEIEGDGKLSIRIIGIGDYNTVPAYGSREHPDPVAKPVLEVDYANPVSPNRIYWDGVSGSWGDATHWSTDETATQPEPEDVPGALDDVIFNVSGQNVDQDVDLGQLNRFATSMTFRSPGTTFFRRDPVTAGTNRIALGTGGLTMQPGAGAVTFGDSKQRVELNARASLSLTNHSSSLLQFNSPVSSSAPDTTTTLTVNGAGSGGVEFNTTVNNGSSTNALTALTIDTTGGFTLLRNGSSNFSGGLTLHRGLLASRTSSGLGAGTVTINGGTFGSVVSARSYANSLVINNDFQLGGANVPGLGNSNSTFSGPVDLGGGNRTITLANNATFNGVISNGGLNIIANPTSRVLTLGGNSTYSGPTNLNAGTLIINGDNSAATGTVNVANGARLGGNGTSGGTVVISSGGGLGARITDWNGAAGTGYDDLAVASLNVGTGEVTVLVNTTGLMNFTETNRSFTILNVPGGISGFDPALAGISAPGFTGIGTWALVEAGDSLVLEYTVGIADPYLAWAEGLDIADKSKGADPDHDGISNLMEFVLGGDPGISETNILPTVEVTTTGISFSYVRREGSKDVKQVMQYGSDLIGWTDVVIPAGAGTTNLNVSTVTMSAPAGGMQTVSVTVPCSESAGGKCFARLVVGP